jgi:hypothetical protein
MATFIRRSVTALRPSPFSSPASLRTFAASSSHLQQPAKAPALADVLPNGASSFDAKQKEFRENVIAAQKEREKRESQCKIKTLP